MLVARQGQTKPDAFYVDLWQVSMLTVVCWKDGCPLFSCSEIITSHLSSQCTGESVCMIHFLHLWVGQTSQFSSISRISSWSNQPWFRFGPRSEMELQSSLQILTELEMHIRDSGQNPFTSQKPEQVQACPNKPPVYCNSHYISFQGLLPRKELEEPRPEN